MSDRSRRSREQLMKQKCVTVKKARRYDLMEKQGSKPEFQWWQKRKPYEGLI